MSINNFFKAIIGNKKDSSMEDEKESPVASNNEEGINSFEEQNKSLSNEVKKLENENLNLNNKIKNYEDDIKSLTNQIQELQEQNEKLKSEQAEEEKIEEEILLGDTVKIKFSKYASEKGAFLESHLVGIDDGFCYYKLEINDSKLEAKFEPVLSDYILQSFINNKTLLLFPYCNAVNHVEVIKTINIKEKGVLKRIDSDWFVESKCKIELI